MNFELKKSAGAQRQPTTAAWRRRADLLRTLTRRELAARYKGSMLGALWIILTPLVLIAIFTFIFAGIFGARFGAQGTAWDYALYLFCGLLPWTAFQDSAITSASAITNQANLVKRVVFPLETLPLAQVGAALVTQLCGTVALLIVAVFLQGTLHPTLLWLPVLLAPQLLVMCGAAWLTASLGVYLRDLTQGLTLLLMTWLYLTPIIYPETGVPDKFRGWLALNPFTPLVRSYRRILLEGAAPDWRGMLYFSAFAVLLCLLGYWWFARTRRGFADVL